MEEYSEEEEMDEEMDEEIEEEEDIEESPVKKVTKNGAGKVRPRLLDHKLLTLSFCQFSMFFYFKEKEAREGRG